MVVGVMLRDGPGGVVFFPGLLFLLSAPLIPVRSVADRMRRSELERELAVFSTPAQRRLATRALVAAYDKPVSGHRTVLSAASNSPAARLSWSSTPGALAGR
jgi:hypothetical protein